MEFVFLILILFFGACFLDIFILSTNSDDRNSLRATIDKENIIKLCKTNKLTKKMVKNLVYKSLSNKFTNNSEKLLIF